jgi:hypothetical protein
MEANKLSDFGVIEIDTKQESASISGGLVWYLAAVGAYLIWEALDAGIRIARHEL